MRGSSYRPLVAILASGQRALHHQFEHLFSVWPVPTDIAAMENVWTDGLEDRQHPRIDVGRCADRDGVSAFSRRVGGESPELDDDIATRVERGRRPRRDEAGGIV